MAGKLSKETFLKWLAVIEKNYNNFNFDFTDTAKIKVWYEQFKHLNDKQFTELVKVYLQKKEFGPNSPASILKLIDEYEQVSDSAEEFASYLLKVNREIGFNYNYETCIEHIREIYGDKGVVVAKQYLERLKMLKHSELGIVTAQIRESYKVCRKKQSYDDLGFDEIAKLTKMRMRELKDF